MTNEELEVLAGIATELRDKREDLQEAQEQRDRFVNRTNCLDREKNDLIAECNRLRESEANALNAEREAVCDRDDARAENAKLREALKPIMEFRVAPAKWITIKEMYHKAFDAVRNAQAIMKGGVE